MPRPVGPHYPYQGKVRSFYLDEETNEIIQVTADGTNANRSEALRIIVKEWREMQESKLAHPFAQLKTQTPG